MNPGNFLAELKRRNVYKVAVASIVGGWALSQGLAQVLPISDVPNWIIRLIVVMIIIGFPVALACAFEITPEGLKRAEDVDLNKSHTVHGPWINFVLVAAAFSIREAQHAIELMPTSKDIYDGAIELLQKLVTPPGYTNYGRLKLHPLSAPLRGDPRFDKIVASQAPR